MLATIAKPANHTNNTGIASKCMLVSITIKAPTASRVDKDATHEVITNKHAAHDAGRFTKKLFDKAAFAEVQTAMSALRNEHYRLTLPWANDGARILPASGYDNYMVTMRGLREAFDNAVNNFLNDYNSSVERAKERLGDMFNANDYASDVDIAKKFGNYIFDSPIIPGYISTYGADKTNAHKEIAMINQVTGNSAHQPREGFMAPTFRIFVRTAEGSEFQAFTWCRDEASGIARAWREGREFGHNVAAVWAEAV